MRMKRNTFRDLVEKPEGKRSLEMELRGSHRTRMGGRGLDSCGSVYRQVASCYKLCYEHSGPINTGKSSSYWGTVSFSRSESH
jgi:hypothetical protein